VLKSDAGAALLQGMEAVLSGKQFLSRSLAEINEMGEMDG
jgi:hypothetical protein